ncbi:MAG: hypothetical protein AB2814_06535 [Candidatus Sedimenticola endophacoides]
MNASLLHVRPACATEEQRFQDLMQAHHYLGALVKIGNTIRYVAEREGRQECRYLVKDFGTSQSPKSTRQRDSRYCPDRPALITTPSRTLQQSCSCATPS